MKRYIAAFGVLAALTGVGYVALATDPPPARIDKGWGAGPLRVANADRPSANIRTAFRRVVVVENGVRNERMVGNMLFTVPSSTANQTRVIEMIQLRNVALLAPNVTEFSGPARMRFNGQMGDGSVRVRIVDNWDPAEALTGAPRRFDAVRIQFSSPSMPTPYVFEGALAEGDLVLVSRVGTR